MARFDVYRIAGGLVVDVQANLLSGLRTRVVVPLIPLHAAPQPAGRLNPVLDLNGELFALQPQFVTAVDRNELSQPVDNILRHYDRIVAALDMVFLGF